MNKQNTPSPPPPIATNTATTSSSRHVYHPKLIEMAAGCGAGAAASLVTTPLDVLKTTIQVRRKGDGITVWRTFTEMVDKKGVRGLFVGLKPTLVGLVPSWAIYFSSYSYFKSKLGQLLHTDPSTSSGLHMIAAMGAGATTSTITNPIWVIKTRLITQEMSGRERRYTGIAQSFVSIIKEEGVAGLYKGLGPSLLGLIHVGVQLPLYEKLKMIMKEKKQKELQMFDIVLASSASKIVASIVAYPHEVLRSRLQDNSPHSPFKLKGGLLANFKQIINEEGFRGLYKGMGVNLIRVTPACAITFTSYEFIRNYLVSIDSSGGKSDQQQQQQQPPPPTIKEEKKEQPVNHNHLYKLWHTNLTVVSSFLFGLSQTEYFIQEDFCVWVYKSDLNFPRHLYIASNGDVLVSTNGTITALYDTNTNGNLINDVLIYSNRTWIKSWYRFISTTFQPPYDKGMFVTQHGSWDRVPTTGYQVVHIQTDSNYNPVNATITKFFGGVPTPQGDKCAFRPVSVARLAPVVTATQSVSWYRVTHPVQSLQFAINQEPTTTTTTALHQHLPLENQQQIQPLELITSNTRPTY
ncbi:mitochondrial substrate carrier family protein [Heterostelium album PN500]|uniref:Mitochondrial substrate carrier family protein n=1 Tax=Heterostelium pallidum (strain ATCC 26659 / Pp 5 / PN500) TaxID=670386 RepID=D3BRJ2_HETP5|nr:mitochondrial substrate carrier family protein [Heterostelium album PN500]EFA76024.1 mitochondrial substrate carrier family protein [Heterostelium album PN500]|eukprot:XP_020428158.1 mitochondrial substrate carrier family protein [Heterostelium album PN500]